MGSKLVKSLIFQLALIHIGESTLCKRGDWGTVPPLIFHFCSESDDPYCSKCPLEYHKCQLALGRGNCELCMNKNQLAYQAFYGVESCARDDPNSNVIVIPIDVFSKDDWSTIEKFWNQCVKNSLINNIKYDNSSGSAIVRFRAKNHLGFTCQKSYSQCEGETGKKDLLTLACCMRCSYIEGTTNRKSGIDESKNNLCKKHDNNSRKGAESKGKDLSKDGQNNN